MAFSNPMVIDIGGVSHSLVKINQDNFGSTYRKVAQNLEIELNVRHSYENKKADGTQFVRHNVELIQTTFDPVTLKSTVQQTYLVSRSVRGDDPAVTEDIIDALSTVTKAQAAPIANWES